MLTIHVPLTNHVQLHALHTWPATLSFRFSLLSLKTPSSLPSLQLTNKTRLQVSSRHLPRYAFAPSRTIVLWLTNSTLDRPCQAQRRPPALGVPTSSLRQARFSDDLVVDLGPLRPSSLQARTIPRGPARGTPTSWLPRLLRHHLHQTVWLHIPPI